VNMSLHALLVMMERQGIYCCALEDNYDAVQRTAASQVMLACCKRTRELMGLPWNAVVHAQMEAAR